MLQAFAMACLRGRTSIIVIPIIAIIIITRVSIITSTTLLRLSSKSSWCLSPSLSS